ncbi:hypothetical protein WR25_21832 [Diploscapter pachys]|uniref:Ral GTPase-activating protein subunit alpha/beta N-terminal domain-containing protein n=1 Tax=Diploscapter pachys TaxID=2018661 RepID=A0A2A2LHV1_9BILA|nr:hypothetical protein WR25_21832 [Diploscapter pachys]
MYNAMISTVRRLSQISSNHNKIDKTPSVIREEINENEEENNNWQSGSQETGQKKRQIWRQQRKKLQASLTMHDEWPMLEFADLNTTVLDLFPSETSSSVTSAIVSDLANSIGQSTRNIKLTTDEQLRWCMQALNHALTLSFDNNDFNAVRSSVRVYLHWLGALSELPDRTIPSPLLDSPEKYFRNIIDSMRSVFLRRGDEIWHKHGHGSANEAAKGLAIERQATQIELVLDAVRQLAITAARKYQDEVWTRVLSFLLNSSDLLLSEPTSPEELGIRAGRHVIDVLFDLWFRAVHNEQIPSLSYWKTLSTLCKRWRHNTIVIESWACKLLAMTVLVCRKMYGDDYLRIEINDDSIEDFAKLPMPEEEGEVPLLYQSWFNLLHLFGSPAEILSHDPKENRPLNGDRRLSSMSADYRTSTITLSTSFFLSVRALQKMIDLFYGDNRVDVECRETRELLMKAKAIGGASEDMSFAKSSEVFSPEEGALTSSVHRSSFHSNLSSGKDSRHQSETNKRSVKTRQSDRSGGRSDLSSQASPSQGAYSNSDYAQHDSNRYNGRTQVENASNGTSTLTSSSAATEMSEASKSHKQSHTTTSGAVKSNKSNFESALHSHSVAAAILAMRPAYMPHVGERRPKSERLLELLMDWLTEASLAGPQNNCRSEVADG